MRTKDEILQAYNLFNEPGRNLTKLRKFTDSIRLEVLIDIRDTLVKLENRQGNTLIDPILGR